MRSDSTHQPRKGEFFKLRPDATRRGKGHGVVFDNEDALLVTPRLILLPEARGFPLLRETPTPGLSGAAGCPSTGPGRRVERLLAGLRAFAPGHGRD